MSSAQPLPCLCPEIPELQNMDLTTIWSFSNPLDSLCSNDFISSNDPYL
jgi:hypothetical protein